jgi:hypothetical protein
MLVSDIDFFCEPKNHACTKLMKFPHEPGFSCRRFRCRRFRLAAVAQGILLLVVASVATVLAEARPVILQAGSARVEVGADGLMRNLVFQGDEVICPEIIPWQAFWDGGQSNTGPDRKNGVALRSNADGVEVTLTAKEGGKVAFLDFEHPDIVVRMRVELGEDHLDLTPYQVLNRREEFLFGLEYPSAAFHVITDHTQNVGVAWGGLALQADALREGASFKTMVPMGTHDLALLIDRPLSLATFSIQPLSSVPFRRTRFGPVGERAKSDGWTGLSHEVAMWAAKDQSESLPTVRLAAGKSPIDIFEAYREANGMNDWPDLASKWGRKLEVLKNSVHLKHDLNHFAENADGRDELEFIRNLPGGPFLWEIVCYHGRFGIHDADYPDFTTFAGAFGGERGFRRRVDRMAHRGDLVSVYTNPFWWQADSEGTKALGGIEAIGLRNRDGSLFGKIYSRNKFGYVIGSWRQPVIDQEVERLTELRDAQGLDTVFQDVYGTRGEYEFAEDFPWAPHAYSQALVDMAEASSSVLPVAGEGVGLDRTFRYLGASMGFYLTTMSGSRSVFYDRRNRAGTTRQWPIGALLLRDKIAFYPHNLAESILTSENLSWAVAAGMNMHYQTRQVLWDIEEGTGTDRLEALSHVQKTFCAPVVGQRVTGFEFLELPYELTRTAFANGYVVYASHDDEPRSFEQHGQKIPLAPHGFVLFKGETPVAALVQSKEHEGGMLSDWDPKAKSWKPVMPWKPTNIRGVK